MIRPELTLKQAEAIVAAWEGEATAEEYLNAIRVLKEAIAEQTPIPSILDTYDWASAFEYAGEAKNGYGSPDVRSAKVSPPTNRAPFTRRDVVQVVSAIEGENDGAPWECVGLLRDGRAFFLSAGCDYTGWDCQAGGTATVANSLTDLISVGMTDEERNRLFELKPKGATSA